MPDPVTPPEPPVPPETTVASTTGGTTTIPLTSTSAGPPDVPLGPEGEKALQIWKDRAREAEAEAKRAATLQTELDALRAEKLTDEERVVAEAKAAGRAEATTENLSKLFKAELRGTARADIKLEDGKTVRLTDPDLLSDPEVALRLLGLAEIPTTTSGDVDTEAISEAFTKFVKEKPYLAASATPTPGSADQGTRTPPAPPGDLNQQIIEAEAKGDWTLAGQLKTLKLAAASQRP